MAAAAVDAVFFDASRTLGRAVFAAGAGHGGAARFDVYAAAGPLLRQLRGVVRMGLVSFGGIAAEGLVEAAIAELGEGVPFDAVLAQTQALAAPTHFAALANRVPAPPSRCLFVSRDPVQRSRALEAGLRVAPALKYVPALVAGEQATYVRLRPPAGWVPPMAELASIPGFDLLELGAAQPTLYGFATESAVRVLEAASVAVEAMMPAAAAAVTVLYLIRDGLDEAFVSSVRQQLRVVEETPAGLLVGIPPDRSIAEFHPAVTAHGHTIRIPVAVSAPRTLTAMSATDAADWAPSTAAGGGSPVAAGAASPCDPPLLPVGTLSAAAAAALAALDGALVSQFLAPLVGAAPSKAPGSVNISSRAVDNHPANQAAVDHLFSELQACVGNASTHDFTCDVGVRQNVLAEITGQSCPKSLVVIGAHLDSTASSTPGWAKGFDAAPGADDDASGLAGVLAAATVLATLGPPKRTIRFMLFNAEEIGFLGSGAYCEDLNDIGTEQVTAMLQMDMIGYRTPLVPQRRVELHPPGDSDFTSVYPDVVARSQAIAGAIAAAAAVVSPALAVQTYPIAPCTTDPVAWRSDHNAFLVAQRPACAVSEELFGDSCATPGAHPHPGYHTINDTLAIVDVNYVADIARAVAAAAWMIANG